MIHNREDFKSPLQILSRVSWLTLSLFLLGLCIIQISLEGCLIGCYWTYFFVLAGASVPVLSKCWVFYADFSIFQCVYTIGHWNECHLCTSFLWLPYCRIFWANNFCCYSDNTLQMVMKTVVHLKCDWSLTLFLLWTVKVVLGNMLRFKPSITVT